MNKGLEKIIGTELYDKIEVTIGLYLKGAIPTTEFDNNFTMYINEVIKKEVPDHIISNLNSIYAKVRGHYENN